MPKKKCKSPRSFKAKSVLKFWSNLEVASSDELATIMLSTYIIINIMIPDLLYRNNDVSALEGAKQSFCNLELSRE
jgi:hypothetical protein